MRIYNENSWKRGIFLWLIYITPYSFEALASVPKTLYGTQILRIVIQDRRFCVRAVAKSSVGIYVSSRYRYDSRDWYRTGGSWLLSNHAQYLYYGGDLSDDRTSRSKPVGTFPTRWTPKRVGSDSYHGSYSFAEIRSRGWFGRYSGDQSFRNTTNKA